MFDDENRARIGYRGSVSSRAKDIIAKTMVVIAGCVLLASAFVLSLAFLAVALVLLVVFGGYLWWKTRTVRKHIRAEYQKRAHAQPERADVIEGVVISRGAEREDR
jgi:ABC-type bacteriocin/lantibiotic exporter with double-glycine peptidase domain